MNFFINIRDSIYYNRKKIIIIFVAITCIMIFYIYNNTNTFSEENIVEYKEEIEQNTFNNIDQEIENNEEKEELYVVDIKGYVKNPGTYELPKEKRVIDVINMAGGLKEEGDVSTINLSQKIFDEMVIIIPSKTDIKAKENNSTNNLINNTPNININTQTNNNINNKNQDSKISINTADLSLLMTIKGIGEVKAKAIIEYRNKNGLFNKIEDITNVKGIGSSTFEKIKDYIKI